MVGEDAERQRPPPPSVAAFAATAATAASREASAVDARFRVLPRASPAADADFAARRARC